MIKRIKNWLAYRLSQLNQLNLIPEIVSHHHDDLKSPKINLGQIQAHLNNQKETIKSLSEVEFQIFSQWGDDGIIQYLVNKLEIPNKTFIEFGVENYRESNTRFLLINNNWIGYVIDGSEKNIEYIRGDKISWAYELHAECAFINKENINELIGRAKFNPEIGILSIDIDGNDYWIMESIDCINPIILIAEYNSLFGKNTLWTVPYDPLFIRGEKHPSLVYYGASLKALESQASKKGYSLIGCNSKGNNAYFIRNDKLGFFKRTSVEEAYVLSTFREALIDGMRPSGTERIKLIEGMEIFDIEKKSVVKIDRSLIEY